MRRFPRRYYRNPVELARDMRTTRLERRRIKVVHGSDVIDRALQERLMLTVTEVNGCRYCAYVHAKIALAAGLTEADVDALAQGSMQGCPPDDIPAVLYAQHWAETDGNPDPEARRSVLETYGRAKVEAMELSMRMIRVGNLLGNSWDYVLYRLSLGRWGNVEHA